MGLLSTKKSLTLAAAKEIGAAAEAEARKNNFTNCVAIFDDGGNLLYLVTMDGTQTGSINVAQQKTKGVDIEASWRQELGSLGRVTFRALASHINNLTTINGPVKTEAAGQNSGGVYNLTASIALPAVQRARNPGYPTADINAATRETVFFGERGAYEVGEREGADEPAVSKIRDPEGRGDGGSEDGQRLPVEVADRHRERGCEREGPAMAARERRSRNGFNVMKWDTRGVRVRPTSVAGRSRSESGRWRAPTTSPTRAAIASGAPCTSSSTHASAPS